MVQQLSPEAKKRLESQHYRIVGSHSAVKTCGWTKSMLKGEGGCYKLKFYGIQSHQCMQMTPSVSCANRCTFCWRDYKAPVSKEWTWEMDDPAFILENSLRAHERLLVGMKGHPKVKAASYASSEHVKHVALSLTGEPISYPKINELIQLFHQRGISTFLVTNAQFPEAIKQLAPVTQLYVSVDAGSKELLKKIDTPLFVDYWERFQKSLAYLAEKKQRTCIRLTLVKGLNMEDCTGYAALIEKGKPDFIELKAYMHIGASQERLLREQMPLHEEVVAFAQELIKHLPDYELAAEHISSRIVMCAKKIFKKKDGWHTWIDFDTFNTLALSGNDFTMEDYLKKTPAGLTGISGKGTLDRKDPKFRHGKTLRELRAQNNVNEKTEELQFWKI